MGYFVIIPIAIGVAWVVGLSLAVRYTIKGVKYINAQKRIYNKLNNQNVENYIKCLSKLNSINNWNQFRNTFFYINNSEYIFTELKEKLYKEAYKKGFHLENVKINKSKEELEKEEEERKRASGEEGENNLKYNLKWLPSEYKVIRNVNLDHRIESQEFDAIVIGPTGIFHIENKNEGGKYGCKVIIETGGRWRRINYSGEEKPLISPVAQLDRHDRVLNDILKENFKEKGYTALGIIVLSNYKTVVEGFENCEVPVVKVDNIARFISNYKSTYNLTDEEVSLIHNKLDSLKLKKNYL